MTQMSTNKSGLSSNGEMGVFIWVKASEQKCSGCSCWNYIINSTHSWECLYVPRTMLPKNLGPRSMWYTLWCEPFGKMRLDHIPDVLNNMVGRGSYHWLASLCFLEGNFWILRVVRIVDQQWTTCSSFVDVRLGKFQLFTCMCGMVDIHFDFERWKCTVALVSVKSCGSLFCGSGALLASFMVQPISLLQNCFLLQWNTYCSWIFIHVTCLRSCNMTGYPNTWLTNCALPFFYDI